LTPSNNDRGFTVIEVLVAMVILTVALVSMAELMAVTLRLQQLGRNQTAATRLAQDKIDELMAQNWGGAAPSAQLAVGGSLTADVANHFDTPPVVPGAASLNYRRRWVITAGPEDDDTFPAPNNNVLADRLRVITVRVIPVVTDRRTYTPTDLTTIVRCWPCPPPPPAP
jgi:prepilin-type N-terminal cleavage/methylation domain-containing protein